MVLLERDFFARDTVSVAHDLLGCILRVDGGEIAARIVEVEAYLGISDPASHAFRGPTPRSRIMFGPPGHLYVYLSYGIHFCANVVTETEGVAGAVLLRAAEVESGTEAVLANRGLEGKIPLPAPHRLLSGPGNLCRGLGILMADNGSDLCGGAGRIVLLADGARPPRIDSPRVGISRAQELQLRFAWQGHAAVSHPHPAPA